MLQTLRNAFKVPEIRNKLLFVGLILILYRIGAVMPVPFVDSALMNIYLEQQGSGSILNYLNILSGSAFGYGTLFALSVSPYITSSIVLQLLDVAFPKWFGGPSADPQEKRKKMTVWTRIITVLLAIITSYGYYVIMKNNGVLDARGETLLGGIVIVVCYCVGAALIMWLGEQIDQKGIGNGVSLLIFTGIISNLAHAVITNVYNLFTNPTMVKIPAMIAGLVVFIVLIVGMVSAFAVSLVCIRFLMDYIKRHDFAVFGWYRIVVGVVVLAYFAVKGTLF